jgi:hypothetical protein
MIEYYNPFEYEAATKLTSEKILEFYIEDHNYSRFIRSRRNIMLVGERGTGKSMALLFNSFPVIQKKAQMTNQELGFDVICVYIPCNQPLTHRSEYQLLKDYEASIVSEHFLVLSIMFYVTDTLSRVPNVLDGTDESAFKSHLTFALDLDLPPNETMLVALKQAIQKELSKSQKVLNARVKDAFYENALSFSSGVLPLLSSLRTVQKLKGSHFALMFDDVHDLNPYQQKSLNSWISYRDNTMFSFKVATAKVDQPTLLTATGGTILEGHDFTLIDMEQAYQSQYTDFGRLARDVVSKRLASINIKKTPDEYFPTSPQFERDILKCTEIVGGKAKQKYPNGTPKQISDYVYKYARAEYFRSRSPRANLPHYSGFDTLVHLSTGIMRNLLHPCYLMYDAVYSMQKNKGEQTIVIQGIPYSTQNQVIIDRSDKTWNWIRDGLDRNIEGCSREQGEQIYRLFDNLAMHFVERLYKHESEPRAIVFTISEMDIEERHELEELLRIARKAQILYTRSGSAKDHGRREIYYVPNRILWPERGLDPCGQHARVSIKARHLWAAAKNNTTIPMDRTEETGDQTLTDMQGVLF